MRQDVPDINVEKSFPDHRKTMQLESELHREPETWLVRLWCYTARHYPLDGRLSGFSADAIEKVVKWRYGAGKLVSALLKVGFLDPIPESEGGGFAVHDWADHAGHFLRYHERAKKGAAGRHAKKVDPASSQLEADYKQSTSTMHCAALKSKTDNGSDSAIALAWLFRSLLKGRCPNSQETEEACGAAFDDLIAAGVTADAIEAAMRKRGKHSEPLWEFCKRLAPKKNGKPSIFTGLREFAARGEA